MQGRRSNRKEPKAANRVRGEHHRCVSSLTSFSMSGSHSIAADALKNGWCGTDGDPPSPGCGPPEKVVLPPSAMIYFARSPLMRQQHLRMEATSEIAALVRCARLDENERQSTGTQSSDLVCER
jgi:hypothetical protein